MADVKWIKITTDIFDDEKMLLIEALPDANAIIVVWFKLLCLAGKMNNSGVFVMNDRIAYTDKMLSTIFRMNESTVKFALQTFEQFGMIEMIDGVITIPNWGKHQSLDKIESRNEYMKNYMQNYRQKQNQISCKVNSKVNSKVNVNSLEEDIERDKDIDKDKYIVEQDSTTRKEIVDYLNLVCHTNYKATTKNTVKHINARLSEGYTLDDFKTVIDKKSSEWLGTSMEQYLRPDTLFGTKFESYLNQQIVREIKNVSHSNRDLFAELENCK